MDKVRRLYCLTVLPCLAIGALAFLLDGLSALHSSAELDYGEGIVMWQAAHVTDWAAAYHPVNVAPYVVFHYPPLYHLASLAASKVTRDLLSGGRLVSVGSLAGILVIMGALSLYSSPRPIRWIAATTAALLIFTLPAWPWACLMRVDTFALLLSFAGIALFAAGRQREPLIYIAFLFFVAAIFTKQTMVAGPLGCGLLLFLEKPRLFVRVAVMTVAAGVGTFALLQFLTHGYYFTNIFSYNRNVFIPGQLLRLELEHLESSGPVVAASLLLPAAFLLRTRPRRLVRVSRALLSRSPFTRLVAVTSAVLIVAIAVTVTVGKQGANYNYFFEMDLLAALGAGLFAGWLLARRREDALPSRWQFAFFATIVLALHCTRVEPRIYTAVAARRNPAPAYAARMVEVLRDIPGLVYSEDMTVLGEAGKEIVAEPAIITTLALGGQWDERPFVRQIEEGRLSMIVVSTSLGNKDRFTPQVAQAIENRYVLKRQIGPYSLYESR